MLNKIKVFFRLFIKIFAFIFLLIVFLLTSLCVYPFYLFSKESFRRSLTYIAKWHISLLVLVLGIKIRVKGEKDSVKGGSLIVSNHLSYIDVLVIMSCLPSCFVTSVEIKNTPFLGHLCQLAGCVFVERRNKSNIEREISEITGALKNGENVVIFPEATSTNGDTVLRFKRPLFQSAILAKSQVQPLCLNYNLLDGEVISRENRDQICWYGDMTFIDHLLSVMKIKRINVAVSLLDPVDVQDNDVERLSVQSHIQIKKKFKPLNRELLLC